MAFQYKILKDGYALGVANGIKASVDRINKHLADMKLSGQWFKRPGWKEPACLASDQSLFTMERS